MDTPNIPQLNEKDEVARVICTVLDNDLCRITEYEWGWSVTVRHIGAEPFCVIRDGDRIETNYTYRVGKKRMEKILDSIKSAQERAK